MEVEGQYGSAKKCNCSANAAFPGSFPRASRVIPVPFPLRFSWRSASICYTPTSATGMSPEALAPSRHLSRNTTVLLNQEREKSLFTGHFLGSDFLRINSRKSGVASRGRSLRSNRSECGTSRCRKSRCGARFLAVCNTKKMRVFTTRHVEDHKTQRLQERKRQCVRRRNQFREGNTL